MNSAALNINGCWTLTTTVLVYSIDFNWRQLQFVTSLGQGVRWVMRSGWSCQICWQQDKKREANDFSADMSALNRSLSELCLPLLSVFLFYLKIDSTSHFCTLVMLNGKKLTWSRTFTPVTCHMFGYSVLFWHIRNVITAWQHLIDANRLSRVSQNKTGIM